MWVFLVLLSSFFAPAPAAVSGPYDRCREALADAYERLGRVPSEISRDEAKELVGKARLDRKGFREKDQSELLAAITNPKNLVASIDYVEVEGGVLVVAADGKSCKVLKDGWVFEAD